MGKTISFVKVELERDAAMLHEWQQQPYVIPFWKLDIPFEAYVKHLEKFLADTHQTLYLGLIDGVPMSYWEAYWVKGDVVEDTYDYHPHDQGIHLLIGEEAYLGKGYALPMLRAMVAFQFLSKKTEKVIAEPDITNDKMIHVFETCGFEKVKPIQLPDKTGMLMFCHRETFERRWSDVIESAAGESV
ncbi:GNAT family N-acetyltransferase [Fictibacillus aquaticus]|uniref:Lysine N-acyltransferase MbtK n=1 Tax=Fictibacillus aquaticus TaxID=2021314 RepID=A0A235F6G5_9BACL|nr:GNAT family N-acetyltransferase [Fictibacillus aquaticus]OYD56819.1 GNAT family N-acetyltransferase [Fictibacillus aquaticus]